MSKRPRYWLEKSDTGDGVDVCGPNGFRHHVCTRATFWQRDYAIGRGEVIVPVTDSNGIHEACGRVEELGL